MLSRIQSLGSCLIVLGLLLFAVLLLGTASESSAEEELGYKIAFTREGDLGGWMIYVMDADGTNQTRLTDHAEGDHLPSRSPSWSPDGSQFAFVADRGYLDDGDQEIYVMDADGTNPIRLTNSPDGDFSPSWSADGSQLAFTSDRDGNGEIYVMDSDGTNQTRLTNNSGCDTDASWSPDGSQLAFMSNRGEGVASTDCWGPTDIYVMDADGTNQTKITNSSEWGEGAGSTSPSWSPDGSRIAFVFFSEEFGNGQIYVMDADGTNRTRLTNNSGCDDGPSWSSDGSQLAFFSDRDAVDLEPGECDEKMEIYVMNADGTNQTNITNVSDLDATWARSVSPSWSPDGSRIVFDSDRDVGDAIYVMDADGTNQTKITYNPGSGDTSASWSPDASQLAFASQRDGTSQIYVMDADGTNRTRLTNSSDDDYAPSWSPDGNEIAFQTRRNNPDGEIYVMDSDGTNQRNLTNSPEGSEQHPAWSPDGSRIAFNSDRGEIHIMDSDGTNRTAITNSEEVRAARYPSWSADGSQLAFEAWTGRGTDIYVVDVDGTNRINLSNTSYYDVAPVWSPDGSEIFFLSDRGNDGPVNGTTYDIYVMNADGTNPRNLTNSPNRFDVLSISPVKLPVPEPTFVLLQLTALLTLAGLRRRRTPRP